MKKTPLLAIVALITTGILGGIAPIFMKFALQEITPTQIVFTRFFFALLLLLPIAIVTKKYLISKNDLPQILFASLLFSGNIFLFVFGLQHTTSIASQLMYLLTPSFVIILSHIFLKIHVQQKHVVSILTGLLGGIILIAPSDISSLSSSLGSPKGNIIIFTAVCSWSLYVIVSKRLSGKYNPLTLLIYNNLTISVIATAVLYFQKINILTSYAHISHVTLLNLILLVILNSLLFFFLYQWGIKLASPFVVSMSTYLSPLAAAIFAVPLFGEQITFQLILSALLIVISSYLALRKK